jgi:integrase
VFAHPDGNRIQDVKKAFGTACRKAGITDFRIHDLRHTCAAWLVSSMVPLTEVRDLLGHSTVKMTERYAHLAPENVPAAVARLETDRSR